MLLTGMKDVKSPSLRRHYPDQVLRVLSQLRQLAGHPGETLKFYRKIKDKIFFSGL